MERYKRKFEEGTLKIFEEFIKFYNESKDISVFSNGLYESMQRFLTENEIKKVIHNLNKQVRL